MPKDTNLVVGLDVGTSKVAFCVGQISEGLIDIIGYSCVPNGGVRRGIVTDIEDTVSAVTAALEQAERMSGVQIGHIFASIGGAHISSTLSKGVVAVSRADGEITANDVARVVEASRTVALPPNREIIHVIPKFYTVDGQNTIPDPVGMSGIRLEVEAIVVGGATSALRNLTKCIQQAGLQINGLVFSPLASAQILINKKQKELGVAVLDIGAGTTSLAVFENGDVSHCSVLPVGSMHLTNDIGIGLRTSLEIAEKIKVQFGCAIPANISESEIINLANFDPQDAQRVERKYVAEIIHARLMEIFSLVREELRKIGKDGMLPAGVVFTGGGAKMEGLVTLAKEELRLPAQIGLPMVEIGGMVDKMDDPIYSTSVGLMLYGLEKQGSAAGLGAISGHTIIDKTRNFLKQFLP